MRRWFLLLDGVNSQGAPTERYVRVEPTFHVPLSVAAAVIEQLAQTERAFVAKAGGALDPGAPAIAWEPDHPYDLVLEVNLVEPGTLQVAPFFARGEERVAVDAPLLVLGAPGGWGVALFRDRAVRFRSRGTGRVGAHGEARRGAVACRGGPRPEFLEEDSRARAVAAPSTCR